MIWCDKQKKVMQTCEGCKTPCPYGNIEKEQGGKVYCYVENKHVMTCMHFECIKKRETNDEVHMA